MKNPQFELPVKVTSCTPDLAITGNTTVTGWRIDVSLDFDTPQLRLFIPDSLLATQRLVYDAKTPEHTKTVTVRREPALRPGDTLTLNIDLPVVELPSD